MTLWPHWLQHARFPCPLSSPRVGPSLCPLYRWCHPTISASVIPLLLLTSIFPSITVFSSESALHIKWPKYWSFSFSISPFNEYSGLYIKPVHSERDQPWMWAWALPLVSCVMVGKWLNLYEISSHISSINTGNNKSYIVGLLFVVSKLNLINGLA